MGNAVCLRKFVEHLLIVLAESNITEAYVEMFFILYILLFNLPILLLKTCLFVTLRLHSS